MTSRLPGAADRSFHLCKNLSSASVARRDKPTQFDDVDAPLARFHLGHPTMRHAKSGCEFPLRKRGRLPQLPKFLEQQGILGRVSRLSHCSHDRSGYTCSQIGSTSMGRIDFEEVRLRLRSWLACQTSVQYAIRTELAEAGEDARIIALAMLVAALRIPDELYPHLNNLPLAVDVDRALVKVNGIAFLITIGHADVPKPHEALGQGVRIWLLYVGPEPLAEHSTSIYATTELASYVGNTLFFRSGGRSRYALKWADLVDDPESTVLGSHPRNLPES